MEIIDRAHNKRRVHRVRLIYIDKHHDKHDDDLKRHVGTSSWFEWTLPRVFVDVFWKEKNTKTTVNIDVLMVFVYAVDISVSIYL